MKPKNAEQEWNKAITALLLEVDESIVNDIRQKAESYASLREKEVAIEFADGYLGSGKRLRYSIRKHGEEKFKLEILEFHDDNYIVRYNGQVAVLYGKNEKMRERDTDVEDLFEEWYTKHKEG